MEVFILFKYVLASTWISKLCWKKENEKNEKWGKNITGL